jgi:hypothetical protein
MHDMCIYRIEVMGEVDEVTVNASSPLQLKKVKVETAVSTLTLNTDQSGLIGLLRHLHQQGYLLLSMNREPQNIAIGGKNDSGNRA